MGREFRHFDLNDRIHIVEMFFVFESDTDSRVQVPAQYLALYQSLSVTIPHVAAMLCTKDQAAFYLSVRRRQRLPRQPRITELMIMVE